MGRIEDIYENRPPDELVGIDEEIAKRVVAYIEKEYAVKGYNILPSDSLLDYFAGQALMGFCANPKIDTQGYEETFYAKAVRWSYNLAKAMVNQREQIREEKTNGEERERQE